MVQYNMIFHIIQHCLMQNFGQTLNSQKRAIAHPNGWAMAVFHQFFLEKWLQGIRSLIYTAWFPSLVCVCSVKQCLILSYYGNNSFHNALFTATPITSMLKNIYSIARNITLLPYVLKQIGMVTLQGLVTWQSPKVLASYISIHEMFRGI